MYTCIAHYMYASYYMYMYMYASIPHYMYMFATSFFLSISEKCSYIRDCSCT